MVADVVLGPPPGSGGRGRRELRDLQDAGRRVRRRADSSPPAGSRSGCTISPPSRVRNQQTFTLPPATDPGLPAGGCTGSRTRWPAGPRGTAGIAATRLLFVSGGRVYRIDSDGEALTPLTPAGQTALSPAWSPDGQRFAYTQLEAGRGGGRGADARRAAPRWPFPGTADGLNITPAFAPDGRTGRLCPLRRERHRHLHRERRRSLLRATLDRGTLRGQLISNVFTRWPPHRVRLDARGTASDLRHGRGRDRSGAAGAVRLRRHRQLERARVVARRRQRRVPPRGLAAVRSSSSSTWRGAGSGSSRRPAATKIRPGRPTAGTSPSSPTGAAAARSGSSTSKPAGCASCRRPVPPGFPRGPAASVGPRSLPNP